MAYSSHAFFDMALSRIMQIPDSEQVVIRLEAGDAFVSLHFYDTDALIAFASSLANAVTVHAQSKEVLA